MPAWEKRAQALEQQAQVDETHREQLYELAAAFRTAGQAADEAAERLNVTVKIAGIDTGLKQLDLYKTAIQGVGDLISGVFEDLVSGTASGTDDILRNMAKMALGIVKQVATAIVAYQAQAIAMALIKGASFDFVGAGLALAAAAAVAGIVAGLESRLGQSAGGSGLPSSTGSGAGGTNAPAPSNSVVQIPTSQVTVMAAPEWVGKIDKAADKMVRAGEYMIRLAEEGIRINTGPSATQPTSSGASLLTIATT